MSDDVHFDGDPAVDSRRRHLERVLMGHPPRRKWPWVLAALAGGGLWAFWRAGRPRENEVPPRAAARDREGAPDSSANAPRSIRR